MADAFLTKARESGDRRYFGLDAGKARAEAFYDGAAYAAKEYAAKIERLTAALTECRTMVGHLDNIAFIDAALAGHGQTPGAGE